MKLFSFIMAFLILGLSVLPCRDAKAATLNAKDLITKALNAHADDHENNGHEDNCSPLCICSCCSVASVFSPSVSVEIAAPENHINHNSHYSGSLISISFSVWQPPRLL